MSSLQEHPGFEISLRTVNRGRSPGATRTGSTGCEVVLRRGVSIAAQAPGKDSMQAPGNK